MNSLNQFLSLCPICTAMVLNPTEPGSSMRAWIQGSWFPLPVPGPELKTEGPQFWFLHFVMIFSVLFVLRQDQIAHAGLVIKSVMQPRLALNSRSSCLHLLSARITGVRHNAWFLRCRASILLTEPHPQLLSGFALFCFFSSVD